MSKNLPFRIERPISATCERVFDAWTQDESTRQFLFRTLNGTLIESANDPRPGGALAITEERNGEEARHDCHWIELERPGRLVFQFFDVPATLTLTPTDQGCRAVLEHELDPDYAERTLQGWQAIFDGMINSMADVPEMIVRRRLQAPPSMVFPLFTDPDSLAKWWGPNGFRTVTHNMDFREGGQWIFTMHGPDGKAWENVVDYLEIVPNELIRFGHGEPDAIHFENRISFTPTDDGGTEVVLQLRFKTMERKRDAMPYAVPGGHQTLGRLAEQLGE